MTHRFSNCFVVPSLVTLLCLLCACQGYDFTVNDRVVYTPPSLLQEFATPDPALQACLEQTIVDNAITATEQLTVLNCSHAGIESLEGLAVFSDLLSLRLSSNKIRNLADIAQLGSLQALYLDNNRVIDPVPLYPLASLRELDLDGNPQLQCPRGSGFDHVENLTLPAHCSTAVPVQQ